MKCLHWLELFLAEHPPQKYPWGINNEKDYLSDLSVGLGHSFCSNTTVYYTPFPPQSTISLVCWRIASAGLTSSSYHTSVEIPWPFLIAGTKSHSLAQDESFVREFPLLLLRCSSASLHVSKFFVLFLASPPLICFLTLLVYDDPVISACSVAWTCRAFKFLTSHFHYNFSPKWFFFSVDSSLQFFWGRLGWERRSGQRSSVGFQGKIGTPIWIPVRHSNHLTRLALQAVSCVICFRGN